MSKYNYNKDYFQIIDNADKAYWLGFLYADGCITRYYKNDLLKSMSIELGLCQKDIGHLEKFRKSLNANVPIKHRVIKNNGKEYNSNRIVINCTKMCYDLINLGCTPRKTYDLKFPTNEIVPIEYMRDFLRGYFDGDGCIHTSLQNEQPHIELSITGMSDMLKSISDFLLQNNVIRIVPKIHDDKRSKASSIYFYGTDSNKELLDYLYKNSNIFLDRKYQKYIDFYKNYKPIDKRGVYWSKRNKAYIVSIYIDGKRIRVGQSKNLQKAINMRKEAEIMKMNKNKPA